MRLRVKTSYGAFVAAGIMAAGLFCFVKSQFAPLDKDNLRIDLITLRSQAVQGALVAEALLSRKTTQNYIHAHLSFLRDKTDEMVKELTQYAPAPGLEGFASRIRDLAQRVHADLGDAISARQNPGELTTLRDDFRKIIGEASDLEQALTR